MELHLIKGSGGQVDQARISRVDRKELQIANTMPAHELANFASPMPSWRIEGVSIRKGKRGQTLIYMMATSTPARLFMFELRPQ